MSELLTLLIALAGSFGGAWLGTHRRAVSVAPAPGAVPPAPTAQRGPPPPGPERFRVMAETRGGQRECYHRSNNGAAARNAFFETMQQPDVRALEFWDGAVLRSDWIRS